VAEDVFYKFNGKILASLTALCLYDLAVTTLAQGFLDFVVLVDEGPQS